MLPHERSSCIRAGDVMCPVDEEQEVRNAGLPASSSRGDACLDPGRSQSEPVDRRGLVPECGGPLRYHLVRALHPAQGQS